MAPKSPLRLLIFILIFIGLILVILIKWSYAPNEKENGFKRQWLNAKISVDNKKALHGKTTSIFGFSQNTVYLADRNPQRIIKSDKSFTRLDTVKFPSLPNTSDAFGFCFDSPYIIQYDYNSPAIVSYTVGSDSVTITKLEDIPLFTKFIPLSKKSLVIRGFDNKKNIQYIQKVNRITGKTIQKQTLTSNQTDGGFSTDGTLNYDTLLHRLIYIHYYDNKVYCLDSNLNIVYKSKTIDTTNTNPITTLSDTDGKSGSITSTRPKNTINRRSAVLKGNLLVISSLKADNETYKEFNNNTVIDIYKISDGSYRGSFYIPISDGNRIRDFVCTNDKLIGLYENNITVYSIRNL